MNHSTTVATAQEALQLELTALKKHFNPARERLWAKIASVEQDLDRVAATGTLAQVRERSVENVRKARACFEGRWGHPHLAWKFLHRVDEDLLLLVGYEELKARALDVQTAFELNILEPSVRAVWLGTEGGAKGALVRAVEKLETADAADARETVRAALQRVNEQVDRRFWVLSANVLTSVWSGALLAVLLAAYGLLWAYASPSAFTAVGTLGTSPTSDFIPIALLGIMGAYVSNLMTKQDFLFVRGGPYWRYLLHPLVAKPVLSAFAALFVYAVAHSGLIFSLGAPDAAKVGTSAAPLALNVPAGESTAFAYIVLAIVSGFAADKVLRDMIDRVLKRLEEKAEKTVKADEKPT
jgi:hypothetical protein